MENKAYMINFLPFDGESGPKTTGAHQEVSKYFSFVCSHLSS